MTPAWTWVVTLSAGAAGALLRDALARRGDRGWPRWGTWAANLTGSLLLGVAVGLQPHAAVLTVLGVGLLGGLTTFSTWMLHATDPLASPAARRLELAGQLVAGLGLAAIGLWAGAALT